MNKFDKQIENFAEYFDDLEDQKDASSYFYSELQKCYKIVETFIKQNNRILVGGMAIDFALKEKGSFLYSKNKIDYDFISPEYHIDAYNLGNQLAKQFDGISVIGALHASTMRVRYKFMPVADITYVPYELYKKIDTVEFAGFRSVHPNFQMIDQMRSIVYMAENPPRESFFGDRIKKDIKRFCMLGEFYPLLKRSNAKILQRKIPLAYLQGNCLGGLPALAYWDKKLNLGLGLNLDIHKSEILIDMPEDAKVTIISDNSEKLLDLIKPGEQKKYKAILDKLPERTEFVINGTEYEILDSHTSLILSDKTEDFHISHLYGTFMYMLVYKALIYELSLTGELFELILADHKGKLAYLPAMPQFYGSNNWSDVYILTLKKSITGSRALLPRNAYPEKNKLVALDANIFDPTKSEILQKDGSIIDSSIIDNSMVEDSVA